MPVGALSKGLRPAGTALTPLLPHDHPGMERARRQLKALNALTRLPPNKVATLLLHLALHGPQTVAEISRALGWSLSSTSSTIRLLSTGSFRNNKVIPPHRRLLWIQKLEGAPGPHLQICLRPEAVQICRDLLNIPDPTSDTGNW